MGQGLLWSCMGDGCGYGYYPHSLYVRPPVELLQTLYNACPVGTDSRSSVQACEND